MRASPTPAARAAGPTVLPRMVLPRMVLPRTVLPRTVLPRTVLVSTVPVSTVLPRTVLVSTVLPRTVRRPTALHTTAGPTPEVPAGLTGGRGPAGTGCRTGAGCRRERIACTGRRDRARRAAPRAGTTGPGPPSRITTPTAGASRTRRRRGLTLPAVPAGAVLARSVLVRAELVRAELVQAGLVRAGLVQAGRVPGDRPRGRRTGHRHRTGLPARPGSRALRGRPGWLGFRRCASTRPPGRASRRPTAVTGPARLRNRQVR